VSKTPFVVGAQFWMVYLKDVVVFGNRPHCPYRRHAWTSINANRVAAGKQPGRVPIANRGQLGASEDATHAI
jgi:hypothetical protein